MGGGAPRWGLLGRSAGGARRHEPEELRSRLCPRGRLDACPLGGGGPGGGRPPAARDDGRTRRRRRGLVRLRQRRDPATGVPTPPPRRAIRLPKALPEGARMTRTTITTGILVFDDAE